MRLRLAIAIFLSVALTLLACGSIVYWAAKSVLLSDLDKNLMRQAASLPQMVDSTGVHSEADHPMEEGTRFAVKDADTGRTLASSQRTGGAPSEVKLVEPGTFVRMAGGELYRTVTVAGYMKLPENGQVVPVVTQFSQPPTDYLAMVNKLRLVLIISGAIGCAAAAAVAWVVSGAALRPLRTTADVIGTIDEQRLDRRIETSNLPPELVPMAQTLNTMLAGLEHARDRRKQFMADAAHELRTPVAGMLTNIEVCLRRPRDAGYYRETLESSLTDARFLRRLVEALMRQARSEVITDDDRTDIINVSALVNECAEIAKGLGAARSIRVVRQLQPSLMLRTQPPRLRSVVMNLMGNAVDYNRDGGEVRVATIAGADGVITIRISDTGQGIAPDHLPRLFEPFYRVDSSRKPGEHMGLGLFLVSSHVRTLGGTIDVQSEVGAGTMFTIRIPGRIQTDDVLLSNEPKAAPRRDAAPAAEAEHLPADALAKAVL